MNIEGKTPDSINDSYSPPTITHKFGEIKMIMDDIDSKIDAGKV